MWKWTQCEWHCTVRIWYSFISSSISKFFVFYTDSMYRIRHSEKARIGFHYFVSQLATWGVSQKSIAFRFVAFRFMRIKFFWDFLRYLCEAFIDKIKSCATQSIDSQFILRNFKPFYEATIFSYINTSQRDKN